MIDFVGLILLKKAALTENKMDDQLIPFIIEIGKIFIYIYCHLILYLLNILEIFNSQFHKTRI